MAIVSTREDFDREERYLNNVVKPYRTARHVTDH